MDSEFAKFTAAGMPPADQTSAASSAPAQTAQVPTAGQQVPQPVGGSQFAQTGLPTPGQEMYASSYMGGGFVNPAVGYNVMAPAAGMQYPMFIQSDPYSYNSWSNTSGLQGQYLMQPTFGTPSLDQNYPGADLNAYGVGQLDAFSGMSNDFMSSLNATSMGQQQPQQGSQQVLTPEQQAMLLQQMHGAATATSQPPVLGASTPTSLIGAPVAVSMPPILSTPAVTSAPAVNGNGSALPASKPPILDMPKATTPAAASVPTSAASDNLVADVVRSVAEVAERAAPTPIAPPQAAAPKQPPIQAKPKPKGPMSWANVASKPKTAQAAPVKPKVVSSGFQKKAAAPAASAGKTDTSKATGGQHANGKKAASGTGKPKRWNQHGSGSGGVKIPKGVLELIPHSDTDYNPTNFNCKPSSARCFVIKSYSEEDVHKSIKFNVWTSTEHGNRRLDRAYQEAKSKRIPVFLFFSVNASGHFCGMAEMISAVDWEKCSGHWAQEKWKSEFKVKWIFVKDVPNKELRSIRLANNENKPVTNSRDTQEVPLIQARQVMSIINSYKSTTSVFDDFLYYEQDEQDAKAKEGSGKSASKK